MKKALFALALATIIGSSYAHASNVDLSVGINIGNPPRVAVPVPVPPPPPPQPVYVPEPVYFEEPPEFIAPPQRGLYAAVGVPYDMFYITSRYYLCRDNVWFSGISYNGPWVSAQYRTLPWGLRRLPYERVRYYRDAGFRDYRRDRSAYWANHRFHPRKEWKEHRKAEREEWKHERKAEHEELKRERHEAKEYEKRHGRDN